MKTFLDKVRQTIRRYGLLTSGDTVLIACSGGADSVGLLHALVELRPEWNLRLAVGHFNHQLRPEASEDEEFVREMAHFFSLDFVSDSGNVSQMARKQNLNLEEAARDMRYTFLIKAAARLGANKIATGHTRTDQAETFFMRLIRGSGAKGLSSISPIKDGIIIRPLLDIERTEVESYLKAHGISYRVDKSNFDRRCFRNRIRMDLLPYLRQNFDPRIESHIGQLVNLLQAEDQALDDWAKEKAEDIIGENKNGVFLDKQKLSQHKLAIQRRLVRLFLLRLRGHVRGIDYNDVNTLLHLGLEKEFSLEKGLVLRNKAGIITQKKEVPIRHEYSFVWDGSKVLRLPEAGLKLAGRILPHRENLSLQFKDDEGVYLDKDKLCFPLLVRSRLPGDRYRPLGAPGHKKLKEILRSKGIALEERDQRPVFLSEEQIIWVFGLPVAHHFRITDATQNIFQIQITVLPSKS